MLAKVNALSPTAYNSFVQAGRMPAAKLNVGVGLGDSTTLAVKSLYYEVAQQVFVMSFEQLVWVIMAVVALASSPFISSSPLTKKAGRLWMPTERVSMSKMIEVHDLVKTFGEVTAVDHLSFDVRPGSIFGFLGPNGAGKTTTIKMLTTTLRPTSGRDSDQRL